jgi:hypothetical protein
MKLIKILFILLSTIFFASCGDDTTLTSPLTEIKSLSLDDSNISIRSTDSQKALTFTVVYQDGTTVTSSSGVTWRTSDEYVFVPYIGSIIATNNGGDANLTINDTDKFQDTSPVHVKKLISIEYSDINISDIGVAQTVYMSGTFEDNETNVTLESNIAYYSDENSTITDINETQFTITIDNETPSIQIKAILFENTDNSQEFNTTFN